MTLNFSAEVLRRERSLLQLCQQLPHLARDLAFRRILQQKVPGTNVKNMFVFYLLYFLLGAGEANTFISR
jgi:hypothetical protein